jgi:thioredoxin 1
MMKKIRIIVPICIVLVVAGIWLVKNVGTGPEGAVVLPEGKSGAGLVLPNNDTDFVLEADAIELEALTAYSLPLIIDFGSDSCIPCQEMAPVLKMMNTETQGRAIIKFIDVWKHTDVAQDFPVQVIPTQIFITADGKPYVPSDDIGIEFTMYSYRDTVEPAFTVHQGGLTEDQMRLILADMGVEE